jgi:hypothetical protein
VNRRERWRLRLLVASIGALALLAPAARAGADHNFLNPQTQY